MDDIQDLYDNLVANLYKFLHITDGKDDKGQTDIVVKYLQDLKRVRILLSNIPSIKK